MSSPANIKMSLPTNIIRVLQIIIFAAQRLGMNPLMSWNELEKITLYLRLVQEGQECPSLEQLLHFLSSVPYEHSLKLFKAVRFLMETVTSQTNYTTLETMVRFGSIMGTFIFFDDRRKLRQVENDDVPPIQGIYVPVYSLDLWRVVMRMHNLLSSLCPVTRSVLSSSRMMMVSPSARYGFYLRCVMHGMNGMNPRLKLVTVSPGMFCTFLRKIRAYAAENGQNYSQIICILVRLYYLNDLNRKKMQMIWK